MTWQLFLYLIFVLVMSSIMLYWMMMEYLAEAKKKEFELKDLVKGPEEMLKNIKNSKKEE